MDCDLPHIDYLPDLTIEQLWEREEYIRQFGYRDDLLNGQLCNMVYDMGRNHKKSKAKPFTHWCLFYKRQKTLLPAKEANAKLERLLGG